MSWLQANAWLLAAALILPPAADAADFTLPPSCASVQQSPDSTTSVRKLRRRVETLNETDPSAAFAILCTTIPRVAAQYGDQSSEFAWWFASMVTPLIAYMDKYDEALPVLHHA